MYYGNIKKSDIANGIGVRVSLFVSGCTHHCKGCFNEETWDFEYGELFTKKTQEQIFKWLEPSYVSGLTVLGGEPFEYVNQQALLPFLQEVKKRYPEKTIWCYTGYLYEKDVLDVMIPQWKITESLLRCIDVLVDGPFIEAKKDITLLFRGSSNQRLINVPKSLAAGQTILWEPED
ncbi:MAG: anaerobic ribonucleoside-triphosphate reductase activating protein [Clostridiales bacterium]|nr:anaerobic ribonucleoside-triphosphate reductase activating protein [Clostridiales bacterium]